MFRKLQVLIVSVVAISNDIDPAAISGTLYTYMTFNY